MINETVEFNTSRGIEKFYKIDERIKWGMTYKMFESCKHGEDVPSIITLKGEVVEWDWWDTLDDYLDD